MYVIIDTESYRDLQESYRAYNFVSELEIRAVGVLSWPYNQGTYGRCAGMARRPLTLWLVSCSNNSIPIWTVHFSPVGLCPGPALPNDRVGWHGASARVFILCFAPAIQSATVSILCLIEFVPSWLVPMTMPRSCLPILVFSHRPVVLSRAGLFAAYLAAKVRAA